MKKYLFSSVLCIGFAFASLAVAAPTPTPAATASPTAATTPVPVGSIYADGKQKPADRVADAKALLASTTDPVQIEDASYVLATLTLQTQIYWPANQAQVESLIASGGVYYTGPTELTAYTTTRRDYVYALAVIRKAQSAFKNPDDRVAFLLSIFDALPDDASPTLVSTINGQYVSTIKAQTTAMITAGKYADALANALRPELLNNAAYCYGTIQDVLKVKTITHASDVTSWAKLVYVMGPFGASSQTSVIVANAFRATGGMDLANQFIASQTDGTITSPLNAVAFPDMFKTGPLPEPTYQGINILLRGDAKGALAYARAQYDTATSNNDLNNFGAGVGAAYRNFYGNLIRANEFVDSNKPPVPGQPAHAPFVFTELQ